MWKQLWKTWTLDKPAAFGDLLWDIFVVQFAAFLDRLTLRRIIALIPVVILLFAYAHNVPVHPGLMLMGDFLAYIDLFSVLFLLGLLSRATTILFVVKQMAARAAGMVKSAQLQLQRLGFRREREGGAKSRKRLTGKTRDEDGGLAGMPGLAWA